MTDSFLDQNPRILVYDKRFDEPPDDLLPNAIRIGGGHKIFVPDHFTKLRLIECGVGWGRISKMEFQKGKGLVLVDKNLCPPVTLDLCLLRAKHRPIGPTARAIWNVFAQRAHRINRSP